MGRNSQPVDGLTFQASDYNIGEGSCNSGIGGKLIASLCTKQKW